METIGPMATVYLGSPGTGDMPALYRQKAVEICVKYFQSSTLSDSKGYFQGKWETTLSFHIACANPEAVELFASELAIELQQEGVGLVQSDPSLGFPIYKRIIPVQLVRRAEH